MKEEKFIKVIFEQRNGEKETKYTLSVGNYRWYAVILMLLLMAIVAVAILVIRWEYMVG